mgnify:CR=1 FL=1
MASEDSEKRTATLSYPAVSAGHPLAISVRMDALHFFDERGDRIDVGWR